MFILITQAPVLIRKPLNKQVPPEIAAKRRQQQKQIMAVKDQDEWSKNTQILVHQKNQWIHSGLGFIGSFQVWCAMIWMILIQIIPNERTKRQQQRQVNKNKNKLEHYLTSIISWSLGSPSSAKVVSKCYAFMVTDSLSANITIQFTFLIWSLLIAVQLTQRGALLVWHLIYQLERRGKDISGGKTMN